MISGVSRKPMASLYVGNLHPDVTEAMLFEKFSTVGSVFSIRLCRDVITHSSLGYAYINFENPDDAKLALDTMNCSVINGRNIRVMWPHQKPSLNRSNVGNVFVKNLHGGIDNKAMYDAFSAFGVIRSCKIAKNDNGVSKGFGYVQFDSEEDANASIEGINGTVWKGKKVYVGHFIPKGDRQKQVGATAQCNNAELPQNTSNSEEPSGRPARIMCSHRTPPLHACNVYVKNLDISIDKKAMYNTFSAYGNVVSCTVVKDNKGLSKGYGFVHFETEEAAKTSIKICNGMVWNGRKIYVGKFFPKEERQKQLRASYNNNAGIVVDTSKYELIGRPPTSFIWSHRNPSHRKLSRGNIFVRNLHKSIDNKAMYQTFSAFGNILYCKVAYDSNGVSKGFGFVHFETKEAADISIRNINGIIWNGREVYVGHLLSKEERDKRRGANTKLYSN